MRNYQLALPDEAIDTMRRLAHEAGVSRAAILRKALGLLATAESRKPGAYVGITADREALDVVLLDARPEP